MMNNKNYYLTMDIGGTTFTCAIYNSSLEQISISQEFYINDYNDKNDLINGFIDKLKELNKESNISINEIYGLGVSAPGPLNSSSGMILDTPNLTILKNINLAQLIEKNLGIPVILENDANLFALGEWYLKFNLSKVYVGLTLGTGLGFGVIINGKLFTGAHGMAAEYGISPIGDGIWEDQISINGIGQLSTIYFKKVYTPEHIYNLALDKNKSAMQIWNIFGRNLGLVLSHIINLLDPSIISIGGGLSNAFQFFSKNMIKTISYYSPSFNYHSIKIVQSKKYLHSIHHGAAVLIKEEISKHY